MTALSPAAPTRPAAGAGADRWPLLFSPLDVGRRTLRNRIVSTPHATGWGSGGLLTDAEVDYHIRKARGGAALVMTFGSASVDRDSAASYGSVSLWDPRNDDALRRLADGVHAHGALVMSQMTHMGRRGYSVLTGVPLRGASDLPEGVHREVPVVLAASELSVIAERFAHSARRLQELGWDGAEVTSLGGHLIEQFFDPAINARTDEYGGSLHNRTRFGREVLRAVRDATDPRFILGFRTAGDQHLPVGLGPEEFADILAELTSEGVVDLLSVSAGTGASMRGTSFFVPGDGVRENANGTLAGMMGRRVGRPVIAAGRILDADVAEGALREEGVDLVAMTRAIIADPDLPTKLAQGLTPRPCISINESCIGRLYSGMPMACAVNPAIREPDLDEAGDAGRSGSVEAAGTGRQRCVVVLGGGVAGVEAARRSARRGGRVVLFEEGAVLGGRARVAGTRTGRERWERWIDWTAAELAEHGVDVRLGTSPTVAEIAAEQPDSVVIATGSAPRTTPFHQVAGLRVMDADDVVAAPPAAEQRDPSTPSALVVDTEGGFVGPTAAEKLVEAGWQVRVVTDLPVVAHHVDATQVWFVRRRLKQAGVDLLGSTAVQVDEAGALQLFDTEGETTRPAGPVDLLVLAGHRRSRDDLGVHLREALGPGVQVVRVGDALAPRTLLDAVAEGARAGVSAASG